jgi:hypothetical protein
VRAIVALLMVRHLDSLLLFPEAFVMLVMGKAYQVARSALVPMTVRDRTSLVGANSKLALLSAIAGAVAVVPAGAVSLLFGSQWVVFLAVLLFTTAAVLAWKLPKEPVATSPADVAELEELRSAGIRLAATSMGMLRGSVGFVTFLLAFALRNADAPAWHYGIVVAATGIATMVGSASGPALRKVLTEEYMLTGAVAGASGVALLASLLGGLEGMVLMAMAVGVSAGSGKLAFDSLVQRDAPDANQGRSFASFEARFQVIWVCGAFLPVVIPIPARAGYLLIAIAGGVAAGAYVIGRQALVSDGHGARASDEDAEPTESTSAASTDPGPEPERDPAAPGAGDAWSGTIGQSPGAIFDGGEPTGRSGVLPPDVVEPPFGEVGRAVPPARPLRHRSRPAAVDQPALPFDEPPLNDEPFEPSGYRQPTDRGADGDGPDVDEPVVRDAGATDPAGADQPDADLPTPHEPGSGSGVGRAGRQWRPR